MFSEPLGQQARDSYARAFNPFAKLPLLSEINSPFSLQWHESGNARYDALNAHASGLAAAPVSVHIGEGENAVLSSYVTDRSLVGAQMRTTTDVDIYKAWVGVEDDICRSRGSSCWPLPSQPWSGRKVTSRADFTAEEARDIERAGRVYLFGDSSLVRDYREVIGLFHGVFEAAQYVLDELSISPGGRLSIVGAPAILQCARLDLHAMGQLVLHTPCHA